ncbi:uncharacterized protein [Aegilops tauschii subsp. strangulata]|uniref:uncharacterized protein n=1 Tax=Aegilops tauschii subsp. strangulata TaxID=200361 RepID=UPI001ABC5AD6|nr:uncharacterized protein LOC120963841 [Aegilops tauschii subsp. strangulata]
MATVCAGPCGALEHGGRQPTERVIDTSPLFTFDLPFPDLVLHPFVFLLDESSHWVLLLAGCGHGRSWRKIDASGCRSCTEQSRIPSHSADLTAYPVSSLAHAGVTVRLARLYHGIGGQDAKFPNFQAWWLERDVGVPGFTSLLHRPGRRGVGGAGDVGFAVVMAAAMGR